MALPGKRVLIVDDEEIICRTIAQIVKMHGHQTCVASSAEDALARIAKWEPDAAILDVLLPNMNGLELALSITAQYPRCRILLFSGRPEINTSVLAGVHQTVPFQIYTKPVPPAFLLEWVKGT